MQIEYNADALPSTQSVSDNKKPKIKYDIKDYLSKGTYLDAKDSSGTWYAAFVIEMLPNEKVYVGFDGWIEKWNEVKLKLLFFLFFSNFLGLSHFFKEIATFQKNHARFFFISIEKSYIFIFFMNKFKDIRGLVKSAIDPFISI